MSHERNGVPDKVPLDAKDIRHWKWVPRYFLSIIRSVDAALFVAGGILVGFLGEFYRRVEADGSAELFAIAGIGIAALAVALTALSIFVSLVNDAYLRILALNKESGGIGGFVVPYIASALISTLALVVGVVGGVVYKAVPRWTDATFLGLGAGLAIWAVWGLFQITVGVAVHGLNRYKVAEDLDSITDEPGLTEYLQRMTNQEDS